MIRDNEDQLICDLAQYYHIYNYRDYDVKLIATLTVGLPNDSRIKLGDSSLNVMESLVALSVDYLGLLWWSKTEDGQKGKNRPQSVFAMLNGQTEEKPKVTAFESGEAFMERWNSIE